MSHRLRAFRLRLTALLHHRRQQREYAEELAFHQHMLRERLERDGTPTPQLDTATRRTFGNASRLREQLSELRQFPRFENIFRDLGYATRVLRKSPGFTLTAILTIALGIGASTAIFSLINGLLLRPLPVPRPNELAVLGYAEERVDTNLSAPLFRALERTPGAFENVFGYGHVSLQIGNHGGGTDVSGLFVSGEYFQGLETPPLLGRYLMPADDRTGTNPSGLAAVITESYWRNAMHSDPKIIGRALLANRIVFTIVGVMPQRFIGADPTQRPQIFIPLAAEPLVDAPYNWTAMGNHGWWLQAIGRTKLGVSITQAQTSLASATSSVLRGPNIDTAWAADASKSHFHFVAESAPGGSTFLRTFFRQPLLAVLGLCCALLLLACLNLASLLFARSAAREHELATRAAIGATRRRLLQQLLTESLLLAVTGAVIGLAAAPFVAQSLATLLIGQFENSYLDTSLDWRVLLAGTCGALVTAVLIGFTPALHATGRNLNLRLKGHRTATSSRAHGGFVPAILLSTQVALALVLVIGAGLLSTSLVRLYHDGLGFDPHDLSTATLSIAKQPLQEDALTRNYRAMRDQIAALPGVKNASVVAMVPFSGSSANNILKGPGKKEIKIWLNFVAPEYFKTMRIPLLGGRDFAWTDAPSDSQKIVISRSAAQQLFPNEDPVGHPLDDAENKHYEVIGIVGDAKSRNAHEPVGPMAYFPITQNKDVKPSYSFIARLDGPALPFATAVRAIVARHAPEIPAPIFSTMSGTLDQSLSAERMMAMLSVFFAACALLVTAIGLYGTLAYRTARRTSEIGIRMALGAQRTQVVSLVFGQNVAVTLVGAVAGLAAALLAARALASFLYGTSTHDPLVLGGATLLLALVASVASLLPAIRAARINPLTAIRME